MIYNKQGRLLHKESFQELFEIDGATGLSRDDPEHTFENIDFSGYDFSGMSFTNVFFDRCDFTEANLSGTTFVHSHLRSADFEGANLEGASFYETNMRESNFQKVRGDGAQFDRCMLISGNFAFSSWRWAEFTTCDIRKASFRAADCSNVDFTDSIIKGINTRSTNLSKAKIPSFMTDKILQYRLCGDDSVHIGWKLTNERQTGIYRPVFKYEPGKTYYADEFMPIDPITNPGIAIAPLDWILREWVMLGGHPDWHLFKVEFRAGDILNEEGVAKFNVKKYTILEEIDLGQFYEKLID